MTKACSCSLSALGRQHNQGAPPGPSPPVPCSALVQLSCPPALPCLLQREADAAAERASHWCSLAQVLQRSALLTEGASPSSPASCASTSSRYSPTGSACHYSPAASYATALLTASATRSGGARGGASATRLSSDNCSPPTAGTAQSRSRSRLVVSSGTGSGAGGSTAAEVEGSRLITAFHAVAQVPGSAEKQLQGSPVLQHYSSPSQRALAPRVGQLVDAADPATDNASTSSTGDNCSAVAGLAASAELAPGTSLRLLNQLPAPGLSCASSLSMGGSGASPLTPEPHTGGAAGAGAGEHKWGVRRAGQAGRHMQQARTLWLGLPLKAAFPCVWTTAGEQCTPAGPGSAGNPSSRHGPAAAAPGKLLPSAAAALSKSRGAGRSDARASKPGLLGRLLMRSVCAGGLPADRQASAANSGE